MSFGLGKDRDDDDDGDNDASESNLNKDKYLKYKEALNQEQLAFNQKREQQLKEFE